NLTRLELSGNQISTLPTDIARLSNLRSIWMSNNLLQELPENFGQMTSLDQFNFQSNRLRSLPASIGNLQQVTRAFLHRNLLESLPVEITQLTPADLSLDNNKLCQLPAGVVAWLDTYDGDWAPQFSDDDRGNECDVELALPN